ncbi:MAG TPA: hypothetical protein VGM96_19155 [Reyranella sp.]|jgi:hypothetical protein
MRTLAVLLTGVAVNAAAADMTSPLVEHVRAANARFADAAAATAEGYTAMPCIDGPDRAVTGVRYVNQRYLEDEMPAIGRPQVLTYEPGDDGNLSLVAVEYITFKGPARLENQPYRLVAAPNRLGGGTPFYDLLVWTGRPISDALICSAMYFE